MNIELNDDQRAAIRRRGDELQGIADLVVTDRYDANGTVVVEIRNSDDHTHVMRKEILTPCGNWGYYQ